MGFLKDNGTINPFLFGPGSGQLLQERQNLSMEQISNMSELTFAREFNSPLLCRVILPIYIIILNTLWSTEVL